MKTKILIRLSKDWSKNRGKNYPQTWYYMPYNYQVRGLLQTICGILGGHELSKTEWGYSGGEFADRHCRWCDKLVQVPKESIYFQFKESDPRSLMDDVEKPF